MKQALDNDPTLNIQGEDKASQRAYALVAAKLALDNVGLVSNEAQKTAQVKLFLNRIAGLPVIEQKFIFALFMSSLDDVVADAKASGEFEGSVEDVRAAHIELDGKPEILAVDQRSGAKTKLARLNLDRGTSLETVVAHNLEDTSPEVNGKKDYQSHVADSGFYISKRNVAGRQLVLYAKRKVEMRENVDDPLGLMIITRPNTGKNPCEMVTQALRLKYRKMLSSHKGSALINELDIKEVYINTTGVNEDTDDGEEDCTNVEKKKVEKA